MLVDGDLEGYIRKSFRQSEAEKSLGRNVHLVYETGYCRQSVLSQVCVGFVLTG